MSARRLFRSVTLASALGALLGCVPAQGAPAQAAGGEPVERAAVEQLLGELDGDFNARRLDRLLARFEPENQELMALLSRRLRFLFASPATMQRHSELQGRLRVVGPRTVALVRSVTAVGELAQSTEEYCYLVVKRRADRAVPVLAVEVFEKLRDHAQRDRFTCDACNYSIGGVDGWLAVPLLPDRTGAMEAVSFYRLGTGLALDVSVHVDAWPRPASKRLEQFVAELKRLVPSLEVDAAQDWLPPALADRPPTGMTGRRAVLRWVGGSVNVVHLLVQGRMRYLLVLKGAADVIADRRAEVDALLGSFRLTDAARRLPALVAGSLDAHHSGVVEGSTYENSRSHVKFDAPPTWRGQRHGCGKLFEVAFSCDEDRGKLWLSGHAPPTGMNGWREGVADLFLADCLKRDGLEIAEDGAWRDAQDAAGFSVRTVYATRSGKARDDAVRRQVFRLAMAEDLLVVVHGFTRDTADEPLLLRAFDSLKRR